jgi:hypothetical protein
VPLHQPSLSRMRQSQLRPEAVATIFENLAQLADQFGAEASVMSINWMKHGDVALEGEFTPVITLSLHPATDPLPIRAQDAQAENDV